MKKYNYLFLIIGFSLFLAVSCASSPKAGPVTKDGYPDFSILPPGADVYIWADVDQSKSLLEAISFNGMNLSDLGQLLDRTETAVAGLYSEESPQKFFLAGMGKYPSFGAGFSMGFSKDWKITKSAAGKRYWRNSEMGIGAAIGSKIILASDGDPFTETSGENPQPVDFEEFRKPCVFAGWMGKPDVFLGRVMSTMNLPLQIPVEELFFGFIRSGEDTGAESKYEASIILRTPTSSQAVALSSLLGIARVFMNPQGGGNLDFISQLLRNSPVQEGSKVILHIPPMDGDEIKNFFQALTRFTQRQGST